MCGVVGVVNLAGQPIDEPLLRRMGDALAHRGPDGEGVYVDGAVGFHHKRLAVIDVTGGAQPMHDGDLTLAFNGEIYNYVELRDELRRRGHEFRTASDSEVILKLYRDRGAACVDALNGMFAFLIHDRARDEVFVARDHLGVKPLYWAEAGGTLMWASEIKALLRHPALAARVCHEALRDYVTFQLVLGEGTLFRHVRKLLPGHCQLVDLRNARVKTWRYWEPRFDVDWDHTEDYFVRELRGLLEDAVRIQTRSDVPLGAHLSGGMDSSIVVALAARGRTDQLHTFTGVFREGPEFDESRYAREVSEQNRTVAHEVVPTEREFVDCLPRLIYHMDEPAAGPGVFPQYMVSRCAAQHVKVVLGGQGGDEVFGGYARYLVAYLEQALKGAIHETNDEGEHLVSLASVVSNLPVLRQYVPMLQQFWRHDLFEPMDRRYFRLVERSSGALSLFGGDFRREYDNEVQFARFQQTFNHPDIPSYFNKMTRFDLLTGLPALLQVEDRVSMAASIESRVPLLDRRLVELVASLPPRMKFAGGELKHVLRRAAGDLIPTRVLERKDKMGFPVPLQSWARGESRDFFCDVLLSDAARARGIYDPAAIEKLLDGEPAFGRRLWGMLSLELWFRTFIDA